MNIQLDQIKQLLIVHFGEQQFCAAFQHVAHQFLFGFYQLVDTVLNGAATDKFMYQYIFFLADAERAVGCLIFHRGIPPAVEVDYM